MGTPRNLIALLLAVAVALLAAFFFWPPDETARSASGTTYVSDRVCARCHQDVVLAWEGSHHDLAMQPATENTVLADFGDTRFEKHGKSARFFRRDGKFLVETDDVPGERRAFEVKHTFGVEPLQQYLVETGDGHVQCLPFSWDTKRKEWFHVYGDEQIPPDDRLHWTGPYQNWNFMCAECHSTNLQRNYDPDTNRYDTTWTDIDVGCQACHGPGSAHVAWAEQQVVGKTYGPEDPKGLLVQLDDANPRVEIEHCARCHARRDLVSGDYEHGHSFLDHYAPELPLEPYYHADGQILDEVYVYGSFLQTKKYMAGVRCTDCHDPHRAVLKFSGNGLCFQCHQPNPPVDRFPTLKKKLYDTPEHHHHKQGGPGSACVDCHMIVRDYMQVDPRRDHSFRIPRPDLSAKYGTPNACNDCHKDQDAAWAAGHVSTWYGGEPEASPHASEILAAAQRGVPGVDPALVALAQDAKRPEILRAAALRLLGRRGPQSVSTAGALLHDKEGLVRLTAIEMFREHMRSPRNAPARAKLLASLLRDPLRAVRIEAARTLVGAEGALSQVDRAHFDSALDEWRVRQRAHLDRPDGWFNLGVLYEDQGHAGQAERAYRQSIERDRHFVPARFHLANLYNRQGRNTEAEKALREILALEPENGEAHYSLGLLLAETKRMDEAAQALAKAAGLLRRARIYYNLGLVLQQAKRLDQAEQALLSAHQLDARDPDVLHALALLYQASKRWSQAEKFAKKLVERIPGAPVPQSLLQRIRNRE